MLLEDKSVLTANTTLNSQVIEAMMFLAELFADNTKADTQRLRQTFEESEARTEFGLRMLPPRDDDVDEAVVVLRLVIQVLLYNSYALSYIVYYIDRQSVKDGSL